MSVPDEGYFRNASCALNLISTFFILMFIYMKNLSLLMKFIHI